MKEDSVSSVLARSHLGSGEPLGNYEIGFSEGLVPRNKEDLRAGLLANRHKRMKLEREREEIETDLDHMQRCQLLYDVIIDMGEDGSAIRMNHIESSSRTDLIQAIQNGTVINLSDYKSKRPPNASLEFQAPECFFIGQNLSNLIKNKDELTDSEWLLPYDDCFFEFSFSHKKDSMVVLCYASQIKESKNYVFCARARRNKQAVWAMSNFHDHTGIVKAPLNDEKGLLTFPLAKFCIDQVRAACVLMDAEVLECDQIRVDARLNEIRESRGKLPLYDYHVLKLRQSVRYNGVELMSNAERRSPRLHLRRGHWRRVGSYKTWVRWCVVGNEELGMIDKSYSL